RTPSTAVTMIAITASDTVTSIRSAIIVTTGRFVRMEVPRSPCRADTSQSADWTISGRLSPRASRTAAYSAGVAPGPRIAIAGSPGMTLIRRNVSEAITKIMGTEIASLRRITVNTVAPSRAACNRASDSAGARGHLRFRSSGYLVVSHDQTARVVLRDAQVLGLRLAATARRSSE